MQSTEILEGNRFVSSNIEKPPFKTVVEVRTPFGYNDLIMFHESENDGYDFSNEQPLNVHIISDFENEIFWRIPSLMRHTN